MIGRLLTLIIKEFKAIWKDPKSRIIVTVVPFIQLVIFANAITMDVKNINMIVFDQSRSVYSRQLISNFSGSPFFNSVELVSNPQQLEQKINTQEAQVALAIPVDFANSITNKTGTTVQIITDGRQTNSASIIGGYTMQIIQTFNSSLASDTTPIDVVVRNWFNPNLEYQLYSLVSLLAILPMVIVLLLTSLTIARERETGTFDQLIVSPLSSTEILIGKTAPAILISWTLSLVMLGIAWYFFSLPILGPIWVYLIADFFALLALGGVGLFISALCKTQQQAILGVFTFQMPAVLLSGFISPIDNMPVVLQYLTYLNPLRFFMALSNGVLTKNMDPYYVVINIIPLALTAVLTLSIAAWTFKSRLE